MSFKTIIGQPLAVTLAQRWLAKDTNQPLLFYGPAGAGKRALAMATAAALNCRTTPGKESCDQCVSCKKIVSGNHPDVRILDMAYQALVRGEPLEKQQFLRIETVLEERRRLYQKALEGPWKISVIDEAHRFTPDAANVLLKVLEEPPPRTAIFLLTAFRDRLLSTLLSRCQPVRFRPLSSSEKPRTLTPAQLQVIQETDALWKALPEMTPGQVLARNPRSRRAPVNRNDIDEQIQQLLSPALRDFRSGQPEAAAKVRLIQKAQRQLRQNVPPALVYDHLLLKLASSR